MIETYRERIPATVPQVYEYAATVRKVHDGDTFAADVDLGFCVHIAASFRLAGCNARELGEPGGREARANLEGLLLGRQVTLRSIKIDKYGGRYDAQVTLPDGGDLVQLLVAGSWAARWDGTGVRPVPPWPRPEQPNAPKEAGHP